VKILWVLGTGPLPSVSEIARRANISEDMARRKIQQMFKVKWAKKTESGIELCDLFAVDFDESAKILGTFADGEKQKKLHRKQRAKNKNYWRKKCRSKEAKAKEREAKEQKGTVETLKSDAQLAKLQKKTVVPVEVPPVPVSVSVDDIFVKMTLDVFGGTVVN
jgi:hypothetical protein